MDQSLWGCWSREHHCHHFQRKEAKDPSVLGSSSAWGRLWRSDCGTDLCKNVTLLPGLMSCLHLQLNCLCKNLLCRKYCQPLTVIFLKPKQKCLSGERFRPFRWVNRRKDEHLYSPYVFLLTYFLFLSAEMQPLSLWKVLSLSSLSQFWISRMW